MASRTKKTAATQLPKKTGLAAPSLKIRLPQMQEAFCHTGTAVHQRCLVLDGPGFVRLFCPVESSVLIESSGMVEIPHWLDEVLFHHAISGSGEQFAIPEIRDSGNGSRHAQPSYLVNIFQEHPGSWLGIDYWDDFGHFLFGIGMDDEPRAISRLEYATRLEQTLAPLVIDSIDHPWVKQLMDTPTAVQLQGTFREGGQIA